MFGSIGRSTSGSLLDLRKLHAPFFSSSVSMTFQSERSFVVMIDERVPSLIRHQAIVDLASIHAPAQELSCPDLLALHRSSVEVILKARRRGAVPHHARSPVAPDRFFSPHLTRPRPRLYDRSRGHHGA